MAKQGGIHKIRGKIGEASYYQSQVGGYLIRGINQGMSERVKNDPAFANTRLNAAEFGGAGKLAGAMVSAVTQRWRYMLDPTATGKLSSAIKSAMEQDTTNPWGQREVLLAQMPALQEAYNALSKNEMLPELTQFLSETYVNNESAAIKTIAIPTDYELSVDSANRLSALGAEGLIVQMYVLRVSKPKFNPATGKYVSPDRFYINRVFSNDIEVAAEENILTEGDNITIPRGRSGSWFLPQNTSDIIGGLLVVVTPYVVVSNVKHILQQHCSCEWHSLPDGE